MKKDYILVLPSWYPGRLDAFNGDFNERLVESLKDKRFQIVLYINTVRGNKLEDVEIYEAMNLIVYRIYYKHTKNPFNRFFRILFIYKRFFSIIFKKYGFPQLVHTYVFFPAGIGSLYLKLRYRLKCILTEHWSFFSKNKQINIYNLNFILKFFCKKIIRQFDAIICVSNDLKKSVQIFHPNANFYVLPNIVNEKIFNLNVNDMNNDFTFIHVSDGSPNKNIPLILEAFKSCLNKSFKFKLIIIGEIINELNSEIIENNLLKDTVKILGMVSYQEVAQNMKNSDVFVLFSNYENMPCVILEALCCGLPVISSNVGGVKEVINEDNGILVPVKNLFELERAMIDIFLNYKNFNRQFISNSALSTYSYSIVSKQINSIYNQFIKFT